MAEHFSIHTINKKSNTADTDWEQGQTEWRAECICIRICNESESESVSVSLELLLEPALDTQEHRGNPRVTATQHGQQMCATGSRFQSTKSPEITREKDMARNQTKDEGRSRGKGPRCHLECGWALNQSHAMVSPRGQLGFFCWLLLAGSSLSVQAFDLIIPWLYLYLCSMEIFVLYQKFVSTWATLYCVCDVGCV